MKNGKLILNSQQRVLATKVKLCRSTWSRLCGLLGKPPLQDNEAFWLIPCNSIHTVGMKYPIDVYFLDKKNHIVSLMENVKPNHFSPIFWRAHSVLEFKSGTPKNLHMGDEILWQEDL